MKRVTRDSNYFYAFDKAQDCRLWVEPDEHFEVETFDARRGRLQRHDQLFSTAPDWTVAQPQTNPCTGPIGVYGLKAGDTVRVAIHKVMPEERGFIIHKTDSGICKQLVDETQVVFTKKNGDQLEFESGISIPLRPHIGTLGLTPAEPVATAFAGTHGGNMDCRYLEPGTALYLPVQVDGAAIGVGDVHASMGCGELMGTGVETCAVVELSAACAENITIKGPVVATKESVMTIGTADQMQEALEIASANMVDLLERYAGLSRVSALCLLTTLCDAGVCQSFDHLIFSVASVSVPRTYLPMFYPLESEKTK